MSQFLTPPIKERVPGEAGRPGIDFDELYIRWVTQDTFDTVEGFLLSYGIDYKKRRTHDKVKHWMDKPSANAHALLDSDGKITDQASLETEAVLDDLYEDEPETNSTIEVVEDAYDFESEEAKVKTVYAEAVDEFNERFTEPTPPKRFNEFKSPTIEPIVNLSDPDAASRYQENMKRVRTMVRTWRALQAESDYRVADKLRVLIENQIHLLQDKLEMGVDLKTMDLINLSKALETVQRIQRLSLGMSTDNVGIEDIKDDNDTDGKGDAPVYSVEVSENGKFKRLRPRRVS